MENSLSIHIKNLFNELSKHSLINKYNDLVNISVFMKDFITFEPLNSCYRSKNCYHLEVINKSTINTLLNKNCPLCCNKMEDFESDSYLEEIIKFKYYREICFEEIMVDLKSGLYLPIETEIKIDFEYILSICRENEKLIEQKSFNFINKFYQFSIILPLNNDNINNLIPIRGKNCKHAEFFDLTLLYEEELSFFIEFECKICKEKYNLFEIYLDSKCEQLINYIKKFFPNKIIKKIIYYPEWNCFQIEENYLDLDLNKIDVKIKDEIHSKKKEIERLINIEKNESFKNNYFYSEIQTQQSQNTNLDESENKEKNEFKILKLLTKDFPKKCNQIMELPDFTDYLPLLN